MSTTWWLRLGLLVPALAGLAWPSIALGQADTGVIDGRVVDDQDLAVGGVSVTARHLGTGLVRTATAGADGTYRLMALPPGRYDVTARSGELATKTLPLEVHVSTVITAHFRFSAGASDGNPLPAHPAFQTGSAEVEQIVGPWLLEYVPLNGRRFQDLALLVAGARPANDTAATEAEVGGISFSGATGRQLSVTVDGADDNDGVTGGMLQQLGEDAVQELMVVSQRYSAEYGRSTGGLINVVTRSGANQVKGGAFYQWRDQRLGAKTYFEEQRQLDQAPFKQQQFGGVLGGPIRKDRAHFFLAYERNLRDDSALVDTGGALPQEDGQQTQPLRDDLLTAKLSLHSDTKSLLMARYTLENLSRARDLVGTDTIASAGVTNTSRIHSAVLKHSLARDGGSVNELTLAFQSLENDVVPNDTSVSGVRTPSYVFGANPAAPTRTTQQRWQAKDDYSFRRTGWDGDHAFKLGAELRHTHYGGTFLPTLYGFFDFDQSLPTPADYLNAAADSFSGLAGGSAFDDDWTYVAGYVKDEWKPSQRLMIDVGVRYEVQLGPYANHLDTLALRSLRAAGFPTKRKQDWDNIAPRVGFVLDLRGDGSTALRGGYGRYYEDILQNVTQAEYWSQVDRPTAFVELSSPPFTPNQFNANRDAARQALLDLGYQNRLLYLTAPDLRQPSSDQANVGISRRFWSSLTVDLDYVIAKGHDLIHSWYVNVGDNRSTRVSPPGIFDRQYGPMRVEGNRGHARYDGLHLNAKARTRDLDLWAAYALTWTRDIADDYNSNPGDLSNLNDDLDESWAANDVRQRATLAAAYHLPVRFRVSTSLQYSMGKPFSALVGADGPRDAVRATDPASSPARAFPRNECLIGGVDRCRSGNIFSWDARVAQGFKLGQERELEVFVQSFNITNHANFDRDSYDTTFSSSTFGQPTQVLPRSQRQAELGVRLRF